MARARSLNGFGVLVLEIGELTQAVALQQESLALARELGDRLGMAMALGDLGAAISVSGDLERAESLMAEALVLAQELGEEREISIILNNLGYSALLRGDFEGARQLVEESLTIGRARGDAILACVALVNLGRIALAQGAQAEAARLLRDSLHHARATALLHPAVPEAIAWLALVASARGQLERAARLMGAADALLTHLSAVREPALPELFNQATAGVRAALGSEAYTVAYRQGAALSVEESVAEALKSESHG